MLETRHAFDNPAWSDWDTPISSRMGGEPDWLRQVNFMALDADGEPLARGQLETIARTGNYIQRAFILKRHDLPARLRLKLMFDDNPRLARRAREIFRERLASRLLTLIGFYSRPRLPFLERYDLAGRERLTRRERRMLVRDPERRVRRRFFQRVDLTRREELKLVLTTRTPKCAYPLIRTKP